MKVGDTVYRVGRTFSGGVALGTAIITAYGSRLARLRPEGVSVWTFDGWTFRPGGHNEPATTPLQAWQEFCDRQRQAIDQARANIEEATRFLAEGETEIKRLSEAQATEGR